MLPKMSGVTFHLNVLPCWQLRSAAYRAIETPGFSTVASNFDEPQVVLRAKEQLPTWFRSRALEAAIAVQHSTSAKA